MRKALLLLTLTTSILATAADVLMKNGQKVWKDRPYTLSGLPESILFKNPVPEQACNGYSLTFPAGCQKALIALLDNPAGKALAEQYHCTPLPPLVYIDNGPKKRILAYRLWIIANPPAKLNCSTTKAGGMLLALDTDVPEATAASAPATATPVSAPAPSTTPAAAATLTTVPAPASIQGMQSFEGQEYRFRPGARTVEYYVRAPQKGINANTGLMLLSHNWGGTWKLTAPWCDLLSDRFNLICLSVNYLQSGETNHKDVPYDHGLLQAMDCLRALYDVQKKLDAAKIPFNRRRIYAAGASGGGNVSLMVNKLAPGTFGCIIDLCGMPGLTNEIAFGGGRLNAGYSMNTKSPKYLTPAMQEIRDPGLPAHLLIQKAANPGNQVVIVHGLDDGHCNPADKMSIAANMVRAGFRPATHFLTKADVDGSIVTNTGHAIGNRPEVISKFGGAYIAESGPFVKLIPKQSDLDAGREVVYPVTGGRYVISFKGAPTIRFEAL